MLAVCNKHSHVYSFTFPCNEWLSAKNGLCRDLVPVDRRVSERLAGDKAGQGDTLETRGTHIVSLIYIHLYGSIGDDVLPL